MKVSWELHPDVPGVVHVHPVGRLDALGATPFFEAVAPHLTPEHPHLLVDLGRVEQVSSDGVGVLVRLLSRVRERGAVLAMHSAAPRVRSVVRVVDLDAVLNLCEEEPEACVRLREGGAGSSP
jgi:anti-anti-sigma factor